MKYVLFVCSGNLCRSPMAEGLLRRLLHDAGTAGIEVHSAGTLGILESPASTFAIEACRIEFGIDLSMHRSQGISEPLLCAADLILCMGQHHLGLVREMLPAAAPKSFLLKEFAGVTSGNPEVFDPVGLGYEVYRTSCLEIHDLLQRALPRIRDLAAA